MVSVRRLGGKKLLCSAGRHAFVTDRKIEDGGTDAGCSSGELLLLAVGSCAAGSVRNHLESCGVSTEGLSVDVDFRPSVTGGEHDAIAITLWLPGEVSGTDGDTIKRAAVSGGVVSRLLLGSEIQVECRSRQTAVGAR